MGYIEETGAAQFYRDARITPIYEGTNGIQAADLVGRKLALAGGAAFDSLIADLQGAQDPELRALVDVCGNVGGRLRAAGMDDRNAASYPFLTMLSVATCGWLMERELAAATGDEDFTTMKRAVAAFYIAQIVPEALGLRAAAEAPAAQLYALPAELFAA